jgi:hypothetical protein
MEKRKPKHTKCGDNIFEKFLLKGNFDVFQGSKIN